MVLSVKSGQIVNFAGNVGLIYPDAPAFLMAESYIVRLETQTAKMARATTCESRISSSCVESKGRVIFMIYVVRCIKLGVFLSTERVFRKARAEVMSRILVAEDTADSREMFKWMLEQEGYSVITADNGEKAMQLAIENPPDLLLTDIMMPVKSGVQLIKEFRNAETVLSKIPIVAISAFGIEELQEAMAAGANAILRKPNDLDNVVATVRNLLTKSKPSAANMPWMKKEIA
jgi:Response regulators consisting of a CheY-like receiver domain and a winged-helix DNA-binding domain